MMGVEIFWRLRVGSFLLGIRQNLVFEAEVGENVSSKVIPYKLSLFPLLSSLF